MKTRSFRKEICSNSYLQKPEWSLLTAAKVGGAFRARLLENPLYRDIGRRGENHKALSQSANMRLLYFVSAILLLSSPYFLL